MDHCAAQLARGTVSFEHSFTAKADEQASTSKAFHYLDSGLALARCWQLPNLRLPAAISVFGSRRASNIKRHSANQHTHILFEIKINTVMWVEVAISGVRSVPPC